MIDGLVKCVRHRITVGKHEKHQKTAQANEPFMPPTGSCYVHIIPFWLSNRFCYDIII